MSSFNFLGKCYLLRGSKQVIPFDGPRETPSLWQSSPIVLHFRLLERLPGIEHFVIYGSLTTRKNFACSWNCPMPEFPNLDIVSPLTLLYGPSSLNMFLNTNGLNEKKLIPWYIDKDLLFLRMFWKESETMRSQKLSRLVNSFLITVFRFSSVSTCEHRFRHFIQRMQNGRKLPVFKRWEMNWPNRSIFTECGEVKHEIVAFRQLLLHLHSTAQLYSTGIESCDGYPIWLFIMRCQFAYSSRTTECLTVLLSYVFPRRLSQQWRGNVNFWSGQGSTVTHPYCLLNPLLFQSPFSSHRHVMPAICAYYCRRSKVLRLSLNCFTAMNQWIFPTWPALPSMTCYFSKHCDLWIRHLWNQRGALHVVQRDLVAQCDSDIQFITAASSSNILWL